MRNMNNICKKTNTIFLITTIIYIATSLFMSMLSVRSIGTSVAISLIFGELVVVIPGLIFILLGKYDLLEWIPFKKVKKSTIGFTILITITIMPFLYLLNMISQLFVENVALDLLGQFQEGSMVMTFLLVGVLGPICEEIAFRGIFFGGFKKSGRILGAVIWSGLLFGLFHMNLNQFGYAFALGVVSALLIEATGSIWPSVLLHVLVNSSNVLELYVVQFLYGKLGISMEEITQSAEAVSQGGIIVSILVLLPFAAGGLVLAVVLYNAILKCEGRKEYVLSIFKKNNDNENDNDKKPHVFSATGIIGAAICIFMIFAMEMVLRLFGI